MIYMSVELFKIAGAKATAPTEVCPECKTPLRPLDIEKRECSQCKCDLTAGKEEEENVSASSTEAELGAPVIKTAGVRIGNPVLRLRRRTNGSPHLLVSRLRQLDRHKRK